VIRKQDILDRAAEWQLRPEIVEKDYVLGWLLAGLDRTSLRELWVFKGGTCIKKCYFETYRFSEDLDFSLQPDAPYTQEALTQQLRELTERVSELSGLEFPPGLIEVRTRRNQQGQPTYEGRVAYRGPLAYPGSPKIRFDFTQHEAVLDVVAARPLLHPYPDELPSKTTVSTYSFNELLAEKTRALLERSRPRDLYDITHLLENAPSEFDLNAVRNLFRRKCESKTIAVPSNAALVTAVRADAELRSEWANMLGHQLPALPDLDGLLQGCLDYSPGWTARRSLCQKHGWHQHRFRWAACPLSHRASSIGAQALHWKLSGSPGAIGSLWSSTITECIVMWNRTPFVKRRPGTS
jgi:predicted nucleotidyltransferase component of viral defense system